MRSTDSEFLHWFKTRKPARFDLTGSGVAPCSISDLEVGIDDIDIAGTVSYGYEPLQQAIAQHSDVPVECVVSASGTSMANFLVMAALIQPGDVVLIEEPTYEPILAAARFLGARIKRFERNAGSGTGLKPAMFTARTKLVVLTNLHNPTCSELAEPELQRIAELAKNANARVLVDEVYLECKYETARSAFHLSREIICTGSLTKAYGLGGLRCGWVLADPDLARQMWRLKDLVDPSVMHAGEQLKVIAFRRLDCLAVRARKIVDINRAFLRGFLEACPDLEVAVPDYGACVFPRMRSGRAERLLELLHDRYETDVVPGAFFESPDHFRLGIGMRHEVFAEGLTRLGHALRDLRFGEESS